MWDIWIKIVFFILVLPFLIFTEGYQMLKGYLTGKNYWGGSRDSWIYTTLAILVLLLIILFFSGYR